MGWCCPGKERMGLTITIIVVVVFLALVIVTKGEIIHFFDIFDIFD